MQKVLDAVSSDTVETELTGFQTGNAEILNPETILRVYSADSKVYAVTENGEYTLRLRLYEAQQRLQHFRFMQISQSEIINLKHVKRFDLSIAGTICAKLSDGTACYASRRYVKVIKDRLGI